MMAAFKSLSTVFFIAASLFPLHAQTAFTPRTTTLGAERANNTAASSNFAGAFNGIPKPGNISPLPLTSLLPTGDKTKYIAHLMPWFSPPKSLDSKAPHTQAIYESNDTAQVARQLADMHRRGISIVVIDWYGPKSTHHDEVTQKVMKECERLQKQGIDMSFEVQPDKGIVGACKQDKACNTHGLIEALNYSYKTYESSPAYFKFNGRPVVGFFLSDSATPADWDEIRAKTPGNPLFVFENSGGFKHAQSDGAFAWTNSASPGDIGLSYFENFYKTAAIVDSKKDIIIGSAYPGFDDRLAVWGKGKIIPRRCGQTWLDLLTESLRYEQLTGTPLPFLQVVTWNDYEEGTPVEMGIDNCVAGIPAKVENGHLTWTVTFGKDNQGATGSEATIAHFRIFLNTTGDKLLELAVARVSDKHDLDLAPFKLTSGQKLYIEAIGKPMIFNHLSDAITVP